MAAVNANGAGPASEPVTASPLESPCGTASVVAQNLAALVADCEALWGQRRALDDASALVNAATGAVPAWISSIAGLERLYLHNNRLDGAIPAAVAAHSGLTDVWLADNSLTGAIPATLGAQAALEVLDLRANPLTWPPPAGLADPRAGLTVLLPDTATWAPPPPAGVTVEAGDGTLSVSWDHPGAGRGYLVDTYTVNHRPAASTTPHTRQSATASPAAIAGLANGTAYHVFVTATNPSGTSAPSAVVEATPQASSTPRAAGGFADLEYRGQRAINRDALRTLNAEDVLTDTGCDPVARTLCPTGSIRRWEVAVWLVRVIDGATNTPANTTETFADIDYQGDDADWWAPYVERIAQLRITYGCLADPLRFCPDNKVSRGAVASFTVRAFNPPQDNSVTAPEPNDIAGNVHAGAITQLLQAGIQDMCTPTTYCPRSSASREHLATLIVDARCTLPAYTNNPHCRTDTGTGPTTPTSRRPGAPTRLQFTAGVDTLHVTWQPNGPAADRWRITARPEGSTDTTPAYEATDITDDPTTGHTITGLAPNTQYRIEIQGTNSHGAGSTASRAHRTLPPVTLVALEVTQGLQNWQGDIALVKGKRTVVRAFLEPTAGESVITGVSLQLLGADGRLLDTVAPVNANLVATQTPMATTWCITWTTPATAAPPTTLSVPR